MIAVAIHQFTRTVAVHFGPLRLFRQSHIVMRLIAYFIKNVHPQLIGQSNIFRRWRIMTGSHTVNVVLFHQQQILLQRFQRHRLPVFGMMHVAVYAIQFYRNTVYCQNFILVFHLAETDFLSECFGYFSVGIFQLHQHYKKIRELGRPLRRINNQS